MTQSEVTEDKYNGLREVEPTLPTHFYIDEQHYQRELKSIWYNNWVYVCRSEQISEPRSYRTQQIGSQNILVLRTEEGGIQAFHNTCRHRGSLLVTESEGVMRSKNIMCPYHNWTYNQQGELIRTPSKHCPAGFEVTEHSLYDVAVVDWKGFVFINLAGEKAKPIEQCFDTAAANLDNWPVADLKIGETFSKTIACNWKVFWENFSECLHCPGVHKDLVKLVPIFKRALMEPYDDPNWEKNIQSDDPALSGGLREGAKTWSSDGELVGKVFPKLTDEQISKGQHFVVVLPTAFVIAHVDYVRIIRIMPLGPEKTEIMAQWLFAEDVLADENTDISRAVDFVKQVMMEDGHVAELNQKGLHSNRHQRGTLMAEEYDVHAFHVWINEQLSLHS